jgi:hypothetical protein
LYSLKVFGVSKSVKALYVSEEGMTSAGLSTLDLDDPEKDPNNMAKLRVIQVTCQKLSIFD